MSTERKGALYALAAYLSWGLFPAYWKLLLSVSHIEILAQRVLWSTLFLIALVRVWRGLRPLQIFREARPYLPQLLLSATLIGVNWYTYIHAVNSGNVLEASLGYFINPLVNVFLGWALLREKLTKPQWVSVALAAVGVAQLGFSGERFPVISLVLASTFGLYGLVRKKIRFEPILASTVESALLVPLSLLFLSTQFPSRGLALGHSSWIWILLVVGGAVTALPLLWFAEAAQRLKLSVLGFFQYIAPTLQFLLAVLSYNEPFTAVHGRAFLFIWLGLAIFAFDVTRHLKYGSR